MMVVVDWIDLVECAAFIMAVLAFLGIIGILATLVFRDLYGAAPVAARSSNGFDDDDGAVGVTAPLNPRPPVLSGNAASPIPLNDSDVPETSRRHRPSGQP